MPEGCILDFYIAIFNKEKISLAGHDEVRACTPIPILSPPPGIGVSIAFFCLVCASGVYGGGRAELLATAPRGVKVVKPSVVIGRDYQVQSHLGFTMSLYFYSTEYCSWSFKGNCFTGEHVGGFVV